MTFLWVYLGIGVAVLVGITIALREPDEVEGVDFDMVMGSIVIVLLWPLVISKINEGEKQC